MVITHPDTMIRIICPNLKAGCDVKFILPDGEPGYGKLKEVLYYKRFYARITVANPHFNYLFYKVPLEEVEFINGNN